MPAFVNRLRRAALGAMMILAGCAAPASAARPEASFSSDLGAASATTVSACESSKPPAPGAPPAPFGSSTCGCGSILSSTPLRVTVGTPVTVRVSQAAGPVTMGLADDDGRPFTQLATEALDAQTFRFTLPPEAPSVVYSSFQLRWEDETRRGDALYAVRLIQVAPAVAPGPSNQDPAQPADTGTRLRLGTLKKHTMRGALLTLTASHPGRVRLAWRTADWTGSRTVIAKAGRQIVTLRMSRRARLVSIRGTLAPRAGLRRSTTTARYRIPR